MTRYTPDPPADLSRASASLWPRYLADLRAASGELAEVDVVVLADALRVMDRLAQVRAVLDDEGLTVVGSRRQTRPHPLLAVESGLRKELATYWQRLNFDPARHGLATVTQTGRLRSS